jgi:hypothetical protein
VHLSGLLLIGRRPAMIDMVALDGTAMPQSVAAN